MTCTPCSPGFYKAAVSTDECVPCPANTYVETEGSTALSLCQSCQAKSSTLDETGQSSRRACACDKEYYLIISNEGQTDETLTCQTCPKGAVCADGECALRNSDISCTTGNDVVGEWLLDASKRYLVAACPAGYSKRTAEEQGSDDLQECFKCDTAKYILRPDLDDCQDCPPGLTCTGNAIVESKIQGSDWAEQILDEAAIYKLESCPSGYYVSPASVDASNAAQQECLPCRKGEECVTAPCVTCTLCQPGFYKAAVSTDECEPARPTPMCEGGLHGPELCLELSGQVIDAARDRSEQQASMRLRQGVLPHHQQRNRDEALSCQTCPKGAVCGGDGECALRNADANFSCTDGTSSIVGAWVLDSGSGRYELTSCPAGYEMKTEEEQGSVDLQECFKCPSPSTYILNPDRGCSASRVRPA